MLTRKIIKKGGIALILGILLQACGSGGGSLNESSSGGGNNGGGSDQKQKVTISNVYSQPKQLGVGDVLFADLNSSTSLDFEGVDPNAQFLFAMINASNSGGQFSVTMSGDLSDVGLELAKDIGYEYEDEPYDGYMESEALPTEEINDITESFHEFLREKEKEFEYLEMPEEDFSAGKSVVNGSASSESVSVGDSRTFKVLSSLSSTTSYVEVTATAECVGSNVILYVDNEVSDDIVSNADITTLCNYFDPVVVREVNLFGSLSDVDGNGKVIALFTPGVNKLGASLGGFITGFFLGADLHPVSSSNPASNYAEVLYIMVPDPNGTWGTRVSRDFGLRLEYTTLVHELQHAINYNQHVFVYRGSAEVSCLNEGLSHLAEDLMGQGQENPSRYNIYLRSPQSYSVVSCSQAGLGSRGGTGLFLRYLYEQSDDGNAFLRRLIQTNLTGLSNLETAFAGRTSDFDQFGEFFLKFSVAITGITKDPRFSFKDRVRDSSTNEWQGVCVDCAAEDGRGTTLNGVSSTVYRAGQNNAVRASAVRFFTLGVIQDELKFSNPQGGEGYGVLIRTK